VSQSTWDADPASVLFNLPEYDVVGVSRDADGHRTVVITTSVVEAACPACGVLTSRVHQRTRQRIRDVPFDGLISVVWVKKRWRCGELSCVRSTFTEHTDQVPPRARLTTRLRVAVVRAAAEEVRAVDRVAGEYGLSWPTLMRQLSAAMAALVAVTVPDWCGGSGSMSIGSGRCAGFAMRRVGHGGGLSRG
jgi:transposase